jgi:hypothetical protein
VKNDIERTYKVAWKEALYVTGLFPIEANPHASRLVANIFWI